MYRAIFIFFLYTSISLAQELDIPYLKCNITLSKNRIVSGEPATLCLRFTNVSDSPVIVSLSDSYDVFDKNTTNRIGSEKLKILFQDSQGNDVERRHLLCRPHSQVLIFREQIDPSETVLVEYPLHLRVSTLLAPGKYYVVVKSFDIKYGCRAAEYLKSSSSGSRSLILNKGTFSGPVLPLEVENYDEEKLRIYYEQLLKEGTNSFISRSWFIPEYDYFNIAPSFRTILWAEGPVAVPYQIDLIYDKDKGFRYWPPAIVNTWDNIVRYAIPEQIERVIEMAERLECEKDPLKEYTQYYTPGLAWAIHQWHANGSEEIKERTRELAEKLPDEDPCPQSMELGQYPYGKP